MRFGILSGIFGLLFVALGANLYKIQVNDSFAYVQKAEAQREITEALSLRRGQIFLENRNNKEVSVALNKDKPVIFAQPNRIKNPAAIAKQFAAALQLDEKSLAEKLDAPKSKFKLLVEEPTEEMVKFVEAAGVDEVQVNNKQYRFYPNGRQASHVLGFVGLNDQNSDPIGLYGLEKFWNEELARGENKELTLDVSLQSQAEQVLAQLIRDHSASGGSILIQDPKTGALLAMASKPDFDPNLYKDYPVKNFINPAVQLVYEPGSVFKPLTMATGIDTGVITPQTTFVDSGKVTLNGKTIRNWDLKAHGKVTMTEVIEKSINTGTVFVQQKIGNQKFYEYMKLFGFGDLSGVDLPDEVTGSLRNLERKNAQPVDYATAAFGQGASVTPVQLITAFSAVANGGVLMKPYIAKEFKPEVVRRVIKKETADQVIGMMESAVVKGRVANIEHFRIAGKTGTAFIPGRGGYEPEDQLIESYVGFLPASDPKVTILVKLDRPDKPLAALTVVPAFRTLAQFVINYYNIPPDNLAPEIK
jgi:cell division protein FtsI/penicillin-binding protein 2